jgi:hypothetical protein
MATSQPMEDICEPGLGLDNPLVVICLSFLPGKCLRVRKYIHNIHNTTVYHPSHELIDKYASEESTGKVYTVTHTQTHLGLVAQF